MKVKNLLLPAIITLLAGCASPMREAVKMAGVTEYRVTVLGDTHYDGVQYHETEPQYENGKRERNRNIGMWEDGSSDALLAAASKHSSKDTPFIIQLGDLTQGDCENDVLHGAMFRGAFDVLHKSFPGKKLFTMRGNHDGRGDGTIISSVDKYFVPLLKKELGSDDIRMDGTSYAVRYGKDLYIFYDYAKESSGSFVKKMLADNGDARHIFFLTHLPLFPCSAGNPGWIVPHFEEFIPLFVRHKVMVLCAHTHFFGYIQYRGEGWNIPQLTVVSMGCQWEPGRKHTEGITSFNEWKSKIKPRYYEDPDYKWSLKNLAKFKQEDFVSFSRMSYRPSGFVILDVKNDTVTAEIHIDNSGVPEKKIVLKGK